MIEVPGHSGVIGPLRWRYVARRVHPVLQPYVEAIVAYDEHAPGHRVVRHEVPRAGPAIILQLQPAIRVGPELRLLPRGFVVGGMARARVATQFDERQRGVEIALSPLGARLMLGVEGGEIAGRTLPLEDFEPSVRGLSDVIARAPGWLEALPLLEQWLVRRVATSNADLRVAAWVMQTLARSGGTVPIHELVRRSGYSHGYLGRLCKRQLGGAPKALGRMIRFARVVDSLRSAPWYGEQGTIAAAPESWARLAAELGYADHSHLVRDTRAFAGAAPSELPRLLAPELHALGGGSNLSKPRVGLALILEP
jgi:AraC-like DNA-binding protein